MAQVLEIRLVGIVAAFAFSMLATLPASANPEGGEVVAGDVTISGGPGRLDVSQTGDKAIIHWQSFDLSAGEQTHFDQPSASSVTLNRVVSGGASWIDGLVTAPGKVFLVNPEGMTFGPNAEVGVHSLVATTADLANEDFLAGRYEFSRPSRDAEAAVVNFGRIDVAQGGSVALVAPEVRNEGLVIASLGTVELAGADRFVLDFAGDGLLSFDVGSAGPDDVPSAGGDRVVQQGRIAADGGIVVLRTRDADALVDRAINMTGVIEARSVGQHDGTIILSGGAGTVGIEGTLDVSGLDPGESAGRVEISGARVGLFDGARILANAEPGGGTVHIGSRAPELDPTAGTRRSYFDAAAVVAADATGNGDGGEVIVWAEEITRFHGAISARGGGAGDGGFVEVSARGALTFDGTADVGAAAGAPGTILLDPANIRICAPPTCSMVVTGDVFADQDPTLDYLISSASLESLTGGVTLQAVDDIRIESSLDLSNQGSGSSVTLQAGRDLILLGGVSVSTAGGALTLEADSPTLISDGGGSLFVQFIPGIPPVPAELSSNGGQITLVAAQPLLSGLSVDAGTGDIFVATSLPNLAVDIGTLNGLQELTTLGTLTITAGSFVAPNVTPVSSAAATTVIEATGDIETGPLVMNGGSLSMQGQAVTVRGDVDTVGGDFAVTANAFQVATITVGAGDVSLRAGSIFHSGLFGQGSTLTLEPLSPTAPIAIGAVVNPPAGAFIVNAALLSNVFGFSELVVGRPDGAHDIEMGDIAFSFPAVVVRSPVGGGLDVTGDAVVGAAGPRLSLIAPSVSVSTGSVTVQGTLDVSSTGDVIATGPLFVAGSSRFAASGTIALTNLSNAFGQSLSLAGSSGDVEVVSSGPVTLGASSLGSGQALFSVGDLEISGPVTGTGNLVLRPLGVGQSVAIGNVSAVFSLSGADLAAISGDFNTLTVGGPDQIGAVLVGGAQVAVPLIVEAHPTAGSISVQGALVGVDDAAFTFSGPVGLGANITTAAGSINFAGPVALTADVRLDAGSSGTGARDIAFAGPLAGAADTLTLGNGILTNNEAVPLTLGGLVVEGLSGGANVFGSVAGVAGREAATRVRVFRELDASYLLNGCVMGAGCEGSLTTTSLNVPIVPPATETVERTRLNVLSIWERAGASADPRDAIYSNLGNEQLWPSAAEEETE